MSQAAVLRRDRGWPVVRPGRSVRAVWVAATVIALLIGAMGIGFLVRRAGAAQPGSSTATVDGLTARLRAAGWLSMDAGHDDQGGYQMPTQMMPGAPVGDDRRFGVPLTLANTSRSARQFNLAAEFFLRGGHSTTPRRLHSDTFGRLPRLAAGSAIDGRLYFDTVVPAPTDPPLYLEWRRDGETVTLTIPLLAGEAPHGHG